MLAAEGHAQEESMRQERELIQEEVRRWSVICEKDNWGKSPNLSLSLNLSFFLTLCLRLFLFPPTLKISTRLFGREAGALAMSSGLF